MGSILKRLRPSSQPVDQEAAAGQEAAAKTEEPEPATPPAEPEQTAGGSDGPQTPPQPGGSEQ
jgi:hypothetical protein